MLCRIIFFCTKCGYFTISDDIFKFNFIAVVVSDISGGSKIYIRGPAPPERHVAEKVLYPKRVLYHM